MTLAELSARSCQRCRQAMEQEEVRRFGISCWFCVSCNTLSFHTSSPCERIWQTVTIDINELGREPTGEDFVDAIMRDTFAIEARFTHGCVKWRVTHEIGRMHYKGST